jgi:hypothetical protein
MFPDNSIQSFIKPDSWWIEDTTPTYCRGRLIQAFLPHIDQIPNTLSAIGREEDTSHNKAFVKIEPLKITKTQKRSSLPVAALPCYPGEVRTVYRAKKRPAVIISEGGQKVDDNFRRGKPRWQTSPTILVAPYYGVNETGTRSGYKPEFIERVRNCEYAQFVWDFLPLPGDTESILRFDHIQPVGKHHDTISITPFCLSETAMMCIDEWISWLINGMLPSNGLLEEARNGFVELEKS